MTTILTVTAIIIGLLFLGIYLMYLQGKKQDRTPNGFGEFGLEATNPIPFVDIPSSFEYLDKLHTSKGQKVEYRRVGSTKAENIENPIDMYEISVQGEILATLYVSPYQKHNCMTAPKGFIL